MWAERYRYNHINKDKIYDDYQSNNLKIVTLSHNKEKKKLNRKIQVNRMKSQFGDKYSKTSKRNNYGFK